MYTCTSRARVRVHDVRVRIHHDLYVYSYYITCTLYIIINNNNLQQSSTLLHLFAQVCELLQKAGGVQEFTAAVHDLPPTAARHLPALKQDGDDVTIMCQ